MADAATKRRKGPVAEDILDRMATKFTVGDGCWEWIASRDAYGYGQIRAQHEDGRWFSAKAHRVLYEAMVGPIPAGLTLDHLCRNRGCVRPGHLEPLTRGENVLRGEAPSALAARRDRCPQGHEYDTTVRRSRGSGIGRRCSTCDNERRRARTKEQSRGR